MNLASVVSRALLLAFTLAAGACEARNETPVALPSSLLGTWQVSDVRLDQGSTASYVYKFNVHKYLGRIFTFTPERFTYNFKWWVGDKQQVCEAPGVNLRRTTAFKVISNSLGSRPLEPTRPGPKDFGLPLADNARVEVWSLYCKNELMFKTMGGHEEPHPDEVPGAWLIFLNPDELALRWKEEVFLILKRLPKDVQPRASFDCAQAATATEKAICGSVALAAFDVSVAGSYQHALDFYDYALRTYDPAIKPQTQKQLAAFKQSQKDWLKKRDACGSDPACLERAMGERILEIDDDYLDYAYRNRHYDLRRAEEIHTKTYGQRSW